MQNNRTIESLLAKIKQLESYLNSPRLDVDKASNAKSERSSTSEDRRRLSVPKDHVKDDGSIWSSDNEDIY